MYDWTRAAGCDRRRDTCSVTGGRHQVATNHRGPWFVAAGTYESQVRIPRKKSQLGRRGCDSLTDGAACVGIAVRHATWQDESARASSYVVLARARGCKRRGCSCGCSDVGLPICLTLERSLRFPSGLWPRCHLGCGRMYLSPCLRCNALDGCPLHITQPGIGRSPINQYLITNTNLFATAIS